MDDAKEALREAVKELRKEPNYRNIGGIARKHGVDAYQLLKEERKNIKFGENSIVSDIHGKQSTFEIL